MKADRTGFSTFLDAPANVAGTKELAALLGPKTFAFPKPHGLLQVLLEQLTDPDSIVLDSFAGTGTTGQAVLALNRVDDGHRRFVLVEMVEAVARKVSVERLRVVIEGKGSPIPALGGGFRYCKLGDPLFDDGGNIRESVRFPDVAAHVFFTETGAPIPKRASGKTPLLGVQNGKAVYLLFNGVMGDKRPDGGNVLTGPILAQLPPHDGLRIIYGEGCRLGAARLKREGIVFRQIPYEIRVT